MIAIQIAKMLKVPDAREIKYSAHTYIERIGVQYFTTGRIYTGLSLIKTWAIS